MKNNAILYAFGAFMVLMTVFICAGAGWAASQAVLRPPSHSAAFNIDTQGNQINQTESWPNAGAIALAIGIGATIWFLVVMIRNGHGITLLVISLVVGAAWFFLLSDKTGDGVGDNQIIAVVQPRGDNPSWDSQYAKTNKENATANVITAASFSVYSVTVVLLGLGISLLFIILKSRG